MPWLGSVEEVDFEKFTFFFFDADKGLTHSLVADIFMERGEYEYPSRNVDSNVIRVLPREVAQAVMVPTTLVLRSLVRDVGKELPRDGPVLSMSFNGAPRVWAEKYIPEYFGHKILMKQPHDCSY